MRVSLPFKLGVIVVLLFSILTATCLLWTPVRVRYYMGKFHSPDKKTRLQGLVGLLDIQPQGTEALAKELGGGATAVELLLYSSQYEGWSHMDSMRLAVELGYKDVVNLLLDNGIDVEVSDEKRESLLQIAAKFGHKELVDFCIRNGADVNYQHTGFRMRWKLFHEDYYDGAPLHLAVFGNHSDIVRILLKNGADVNSVTQDIHFTPLDLARTEEIEKLLRDHGGKTEEEIRIDNYVKQFCSGDYEMRVEGIESLLDMGVIEARLAMIRNFHGGGEAGLRFIQYWDEVRKTISADVNMRILMFVLADKNFTDWGRFIISKHGNINAGHSPLGLTILHWAAREGQAEIAKQLIECGADVNRKGGVDRETPIFAAIRGHHLEVAGILIKSGADVNSRNSTWYTPLHLAVSEGRKKTTELLIKGGADMKLRTKSGLAPLHIAAGKGKYEMVKLLLNAKAYVNITTRGEDGLLTPLDVADMMGHEKVADLLRTHGGKTTRKPVTDD